MTRNARKPALVIYVVILISIALVVFKYLIQPKSLQEFPQPTELAIGHDEKSLHQKRREWIESLHRSAPDMDWRVVEQKNWDKHVQARNSIMNEAIAYGYSPISGWKELGSSNQAGRTHMVAISNDSSKIYIGSNGGGVWRASLPNNAIDFVNLPWEPISDNVYGGAHNVLLLNNGGIIKNNTNAVHYSFNQGKTWEISAGLVPNVWNPIRRLIKDNPSEIIFAVTGSSVYRSIDQGQNFSAVRDNFRSGNFDLWISRLGGPIYLLVDNRLEKSTDFGNTWQIMSYLPTTAQTQEVVLVGSEAKAQPML